MKTKLLKTLFAALLLFAALTATAQNPPQVELKGSVPPYLIRTFDSLDTARLGQLLGYVDYGDGDTLLGLIPIYLLPGDSLLQLGKCPACDTLATRGYAAQVAATEGFSGAWADLTGIPSDIADGDDDTQLTEAQVDAYVANNGYLTTEVDGSTTNEIQDIASVLTEGNNAGGQQIKNIGAATLGTDAATLAQVQAAQAAAQAYADANDATGTDDQTAAEVAFTPTGGISANNVQAAIAELDSEKLATADLLTNILAVDGAGSGVDADLLDGLPGSYYKDVIPLNQIAYGTGAGITSSSVYSVNSEGLYVNKSSGTAAIEVNNSSVADNTFATFRARNSLFQTISMVIDATGHTGTYMGVSRAGLSSLITNSTAGMAIGAVSASPLTIGTANAARITIAAAGNVGIGTTTPTEKLDVLGNGKFSGVLKVGNGSAVSPSLQGVNDPNTGIYFGGNDRVGISTGGLDRILVYESGRVTIGGNVQPLAQLGIVNGATVGENSWLSGYTPPSNGLLVQGGVRVGLSLNSSAARLQVNQDTGYVATFSTTPGGSNASPAFAFVEYGSVEGAYKLARAGGVSRSANTIAGGYKIQVNQTINANNWLDAVFINGNGNTGIGTNTPAAKLHVNGAVRLNASLGTADYDRFAVLDNNGEIKYRTGTQVLSDLGITSGTDDQTAAEVTFTPTGAVAATNVQSAIAELDTEKLASVATDATLTGNGTPGSPLSVVSAGTPSRIEDADADTYIDVEYSADLDQIRVNTGGSPALRMAKGDGQRTYTPTTQTASDTIYVERGTPADDDAVHIHFAAKDSGGNKTVFARQRFEAGNIANGAENGVYVLSVAKAGTLRDGLTVSANTATLGSSQIAPTVAAMNTATRDALTPATGSFIYNITTDQVEVYDAGWSSVGGSGAGGGAPDNGVYTVSGSLSSSVDTLLGDVVVHYVVHDSLVQITARVPVAFGNVSQKVLSFTPPFASNFTDADYDAFGTARYEQQGSYTGDFVSGRCLFKCNTATDKLEVHYDPPVNINAAPENHVFISISGTYILK